MKLNRKQRDLIWLVGGFTILWVLGIWLFNYMKTSESIDDWGVAQRDSLALGLHEQIMYESDLWESDTQRILDGLIKERLDPQDTLEIYWLNDPIVNAFTTTNGKIYMYRGLCEELGEPEMIAAVTAHEIAHLRERHFEKSVRRQLGTTALLVMLSGGDPGLWLQVNGILFESSFSRQQEADADTQAMEMLLEHDLSPTHLGRALSITDERSKSEVNWTFASTHPSSMDRVSKSLNYEIPDDFEEVPFIWGE